jgi:hypothetical protein
LKSPLEIRSDQALISGNKAEKPSLAPLHGRKAVQ